MRRVLATAIAGAFVLSGLAFTAAEEVEQHLVDAAGDANGLNGQGVEPGMSVSGPFGIPGADLQGIRFETVKNGPNVGELLVHVTLDQPLASSSPDLVVRTVANVGGCPSMFAANSSLANGPAGYWRMTDPAACGFPEADANPATGVADYREGVYVESTDFGFTMRMVRSELPAFAAKLLKIGGSITEVDAHTRTILVAATIPVIDELVDPSFTKYKMGD